MARASRSSSKSQEKDKVLGGKEILLVAEALSNERRVDRDRVLDAIREALVAITRKTYEKPGHELEVEIKLDGKTGMYETFRHWVVVEDKLVFDSEVEIGITEAKERNTSYNVGDTITEMLPSVEFGRIAAQTAKHLISQKVREAEREAVAKEYEKRVGELLNGTVKKTTRDNIIVDLGQNAEAFLPRSEILPREIFRPGDRVRAYLAEVNLEQQRGPQLKLSRTAPQMLAELFRIEVPEIGEDIIQVKAAARDPGSRAKIAVKTNDGRLDPIGACVGMRGARVQAVSGELGGERVDIILWDDNPAQLVINAMSPAEVASIVVDEEARSMDVAVKEEFLSQAIGRNGQNVKLASELTGWHLNVMSVEDFEAKSQKESENVLKTFMEQLEVDEEVAEILSEAGFSTIEEIAYVPEDELLDIPEFDEGIVADIRERASNALLTQALTSGEGLQPKEPQEDLLALEGMPRHIAFALAKQGVCDAETLAEQSVDDLLEVDGLDSELAAQLIMKAREPWFAED